MTHHFMRDKKRIQTQVKGEMNHFSWQSFHLFNISVVGLKMAFWHPDTLSALRRIPTFPFPNFPFSSPWLSSRGFNWEKSWHKFRCVSCYRETVRKYKFSLATKAFNTRFCKKFHFFPFFFLFLAFLTWQPFEGQTQVSKVERFCNDLCNEFVQRLCNDGCVQFTNLH